MVMITTTSRCCKLSITHPQRWRCTLTLMNVKKDSTCTFLPFKKNLCWLILCTYTYRMRSITITILNFFKLWKFHMNRITVLLNPQQCGTNAQGFCSNAGTTSICADRSIETDTKYKNKAFYCVLLYELQSISSGFTQIKSNFMNWNELN